MINVSWNLSYRGGHLGRGHEASRGGSHDLPMKRKNQVLYPKNLEIGDEILRFKQKA